MDEVLPLLTKKQRRDQRRLLRHEEQEATRSSHAWRRIALWGVGLAIIGGGVYLAARAGSIRPVAEAGTLADSVTASDWVRGTLDAPSLLVEYSDLQCPACGNYYPLLKRLESEVGDQVAVVYRHFPLTGLHKNALAAARAAEAAGKQGKFWEMHDLLFERQQEWSGDQDPAAGRFLSYAAELGLNRDEFKKYQIASDVKKAVADDIDGGNRSRVNSTPTFFLNGKKISSPRTYDELKSLVTNIR